MLLLLLTDHRILADILRLVNKYRPKCEGTVPIVLKCDGIVQMPHISLEEDKAAYISRSGF